MSSKTTIFPGGSDMAQRMRAFDWTKTDLGPPEHWPEALQTSVRVGLTSRFPIVMYWGPRFTVLYNDPYIDFLGETKHPDALGRPGEEVWSELWPTIGPMLTGVLATGEATWSEDLLMFFARRLPLEEVYVTFSFGPILLPEDGRVGGIFCVCKMVTNNIVVERRLRTLREIAARTAEVRTVPLACERAAQALVGNLHDIPFAAIYLLDETKTEAHLSASVNLSTAGKQLPITMTLNEKTPWPFARVMKRRQPEEVTLAGIGAFPGGPWPEAATHAMVLPLLLAAQEAPAGLLIVGASPRRVFDREYADFFSLIASHIANAVSAARAYVEERGRAEALAELDQAKTLFFSNISHEFRTPLTLLLGPLEEMLQKESLSDSARKALGVVNRNGFRLLKLVNTLLDVSRIEAGRMQAIYEPTDLAAYTADLVSGFRSACEQVGVQLLVLCDPLPQPVYVDREMWEKIVLNLVSNAFKFTFEGQIVVSLRTAGQVAILEVRDTGVGIPGEELPRLFERFHRVRGTRSRSYEGTGIGLALVQELVKLHGGTITVVSEVDKGTSLTITIPLGCTHLPKDRIGGARLEPSTRVAAGAFVEEARRWIPDQDEEWISTASWTADRDGGLVPMPAARVLVADDNADMREYLRRLLGEHWSVEVACDGRQTLDKAVKRPPDLVLTDVMMPGMDGVQLLAELRANPTTEHIPVMFLSARAGEEARIEGIQAGADDYLIKPFTARELLARINTQLKLARIRRDAGIQIKAAAVQSGWLASFPEKNPNPILELDLASGAIQYMNPFTRQLFPDMKSRGIDHPFLVQAKESAAVLKTGSGPVRRETTIGGRTYAQTISYCSETGRLRIYSNDITEVKRAQETLLASESRFKALFEAVNDAILVLDERFHVVLANEQTEHLYGYTSAELLTKTLRDLRAPETRTGVDADMQGSLTHGGARWNTLHVKKTGKTFPVEVSSKPAKIAGQVCFIHVVRDVSRRDLPTSTA